MLDNCTRDNLFMFNKNLYLQIDGAPMGGCVSPTLANIFLGHHEKSWLDNCPVEFRPTFYTRYVDDTFTLFHNEDQAKKFLGYLNSQHPSIKFTMEIEKNNQLPYLDVLVKKQNSSFETDVYRKSTFTGLGMKFNSKISEIYKYNLVNCLLERAFKICSSEYNFRSSLEKLRKYFYQNSFPVHFTEKIINQKLSSLRNISQVTFDVPKKIMFISLPYISDLSNKNIRSELTKLLARFYPQIQFRFVFKNTLSIQNFFHFKDRVPCGLQSCVVYKFSCGQCSSTYIGETTRHLLARIADHKGISIRTGQPFTTPSNSSIRDHALKAGHDINIDDFKICHMTDKTSLKISESILIHKFNPDLNNKDSSTKLNILS